MSVRDRAKPLRVDAAFCDMCNIPWLLLAFASFISEQQAKEKVVLVFPPQGSKPPTTPTLSPYLQIMCQKRMGWWFSYKFVQLYMPHTATYSTAYVLHLVLPTVFALIYRSQETHLSSWHLISRWSFILHLV
jgi:hypothetical protein